MPRAFGRGALPLTREVPERRGPSSVSAQYLERTVARYFIDLRDGAGMIRDEEGAEFRHVEDALDEAKASARDLVKQYLDNQVPLGATCVEVRDSEGRTVATLTVAELLEHPVHPEFKNDCADVPRPGHR